MRIRLPELLEHLALAGTGGIRLQSGEREDLRVLLSAGFPVRESAGRVVLDDDRDALAAVWIRRDAVLAGTPEPEVRGYLELDSTNAVALEMCRAGAPHWTLVHSESQSAGRGRLGRTWASPARAGLYFSLVVRPLRPRESWSLLPLAAGWAAASALLDLRVEFGLAQVCEAGLKWPNDVLLAQQKVAGILFETCTGPDGRAGTVAGIGVNVTSTSIPAGLEDAATALENHFGRVPRRPVLVAFLRRFHEVFQLFEQGEDEAILEGWGRHSEMERGRPVWVVREGTRRAAVTLGIEQAGGLRVRYRDGMEETILAGEVSIRNRADTA